MDIEIKILDAVISNMDSFGFGDWWDDMEPSEQFELRVLLLAAIRDELDEV